MKLVLTIVQDSDAGELQKTLIERGFGVTKLASTGGFLRRGNTTFLIGVKDAEVEAVKEIVTEKCCERAELLAPGASLADLEGVYSGQVTEVIVGGATIFVMNVEEFAKV